MKTLSALCAMFVSLFQGYWYADQMGSALKEKEDGA
jgi:hypothetical protein